MRRTVFRLLAVSSLLLAVAAHAATRPHYGGTLRVEMRAAPRSLDPADLAVNGGGNLSSLIFETLVTLDSRGRLCPGLATSWQAEPGEQRWHFVLRQGVVFHDGSPLTADVVAASLRSTNPQWKVSANGDSIVVELASPAANFAAEVAQARNGIARRAGGQVVGTGPFTIREWRAGQQLVLAANNDYWGGRPFLDAIEIELGKSPREQAMALDVNQADLIEIPPEQARHAQAENRRVESSSPAELMALIFARPPQSADETRLRRAFALSIDRSLLNNVMLQGGGEPTAALLPQWMTGYAFLFPSQADVQASRQLTAGLRQAGPWALSYDPTDQLARLVAERIVLNARDAGLTLNLTSSANADLRLVEAPLASLDARAALTDFAAGSGLPQPKFAGTTPEEMYSAESSLLQSQRVIPLLHLRISYGLSQRVRGWTLSPDGGWELANLWLEPETP